jgi:hypothetical protein
MILGQVVELKIYKCMIKIEEILDLSTKLILAKDKDNIKQVMRTQ